MAINHRRKRKDGECTMDQFVQSMSIILARMYAQAGRIEDDLKNGHIKFAQTELQTLIQDLGGLIEAFCNKAS